MYCPRDANVLATFGGQHATDRSGGIKDNLDTQVIMAAGAFVSGSSIELSADGPIKPPYAVYFQGGLTWQHAKFGILKSLQVLVQKGLVTEEQIRKAM